MPFLLGDWNILYMIAVCVTAAIAAGFVLLFLIIIVHKRSVSWFFLAYSETWEIL